MSVFTIADTHLALGEPDKSMEVFKGWENYVSRLEKIGEPSWNRRIPSLLRAMFRGP